MLIGETIIVALTSIRSNKLRSLLTMLGVVIGIAAVITMVALGEGAQRSVNERLQALGTNTLTVNPGQQFFGGVDRGSNAMTVEQARALMADRKAIKILSPETSRNQQIEYNGANANLQVLGIWPSWFEIQNYTLARGRFFSAHEDRGRRKFAVVGALVGERLGAGSSEAMLGRTVRIRGIPFEVIGVVDLKGSTGFGNPDERIYIPLATAQFRVFGNDRVNNIQVQA